MRGLLVRIGADKGKAGGEFNGPVNSETREFVYVPIPEARERMARQGMERPYTLMQGHEGVRVPHHLQHSNMHLDPDFGYMTYGDENGRGVRIRQLMSPGDFLVFYAALRDGNHTQAGELVYAIVGFYVIKEILNARDIEADRYDENAHTRCVAPCPPQHEIVVRADPDKSGRLERCLPIGSYRPACNAPDGPPRYRVRRDLLTECWGELSVNDGYIQRSAYLPEFVHPDRFLKWFRSIKDVKLVASNN